MDYSIAHNKERKKKFPYLILTNLMWQINSLKAFTANFNDDLPNDMTEETDKINVVQVLYFGGKKKVWRYWENETFSWAI